jgi:dynein heavy chain 1
MIVEAGFISSIVEFDSKTVNEKLRESLRSEYLNQENFTFDAVNKASQACGPLVKWLEAQMSYSEILDKVKPLREKVEHLEVAAEEKAKKGEEVNAVIAELEQSISKYKEEYAMLITEVQEIKLEMGKVQAKVDRSIGLLTNLNSERARWESESAMFTNQMATVIGDSLLCAAFLAYNGFFDQNYRSMLMQKWTVHLESLNMSMKSDISVIDYLSHPDERYKFYFY